MYKISEVAAISGVSIRTLQYYDKIDLLKPKLINEVGYRFYTDKEIEILQQILFFKELDFSLDEIKNILNSDNYDKEKSLRSQKELLIEKRKRLDRIIKTLDKTINSIKEGEKMNKEEMFKGFDTTDIDEQKAKYADETKKLYGNTDAYKESKKKTSNYSKNDWNNIMEGVNDIFRKLASVMDKSPEDEAVQEIVEEWRSYITNNYYNCTIEIFSGLGEMYVADERFKNNIDKFGDGLAEFLRNAIKIYCKTNK